MPSPPPQPDRYFKFIKMYTLHTLEMWDNNKITMLHIRFKQLKKLKSLGGWVGSKVRNGGHNESNYLPFGHMTQTQAFRSHDLYTGPQLCVRKTFFTYFVNISQWKITLLLSLLNLKQFRQRNITNWINPDGKLLKRQLKI